MRRRARMIFAAVGFNRPSHSLDVFDPDTEVMQPNELFAALVAGVIVCLELKQSDVHHPIGEPRRNSRLRHALEAKSLFVELCGFFFIGDRDRNMPEFAIRHRTPPVAASRSNEALSSK